LKISEKLIGATDRKKAAPGTIRALFASPLMPNAIHGSDSDENAEIEEKLFSSLNLNGSENGFMFQGTGIQVS